MQELFEDIKKLLEEHSCVIVHGLGGFVIDEKYASVEMEKNIFLPPSIDLVFNPKLSHNDGLLTEVYMKKYQLSYEQANERISKIVEEIHQRLNRDRCLEVNEWGVMTQDKNGVRFSLKKSSFVDKNAFGLRKFYFPALSKIENVSDEKDRNRASTSVLRPIIWGCAAAVMLLFLFQPIKNNHVGNDAVFQTSSMMLSSLRSEMSMQTKTIKQLEGELNTYKQAAFGYYLILADFEDIHKATDFNRSHRIQNNDSIKIISVENRYFLSVANAATKEQIVEKKNMLMDDGMDLTNAYILSVAKLND